MDNNSIKTIYLVRHGQSVDNTLPIFQTSSSKLTVLGRAQCEDMAWDLVQSGVGIDMMISSALPRAVESAQIINSVIGGDLKFLDELSERRPPSLIEGRPYADTEASNLWSQWEDNFYKNIPTEDAETSEEIIKRATNFLKFIQKDTSNSFLVVTHGYFLRVIVAVALLNGELNGMLLKTIQSNLVTTNVAVTTLRYDKDFQGNASWKLVSYNNK